MTKLRRLIRDSKGATAVEYAFVAVLVSIAGITAMQALGGQSNTGWNGVWKKTTEFLGY